jgi:U3 small nucleolar RNA-associated protein 19
MPALLPSLINSIVVSKSRANKAWSLNIESAHIPQVTMTAPDSSEPSAAQTAQEIKVLLQQLRKSSKQRQRGSHSSASERDDALRLDKLRRIFARLVDRNELDITDRNNSDESASSKWNQWLLTQHDVFIGHLVDGIIAGKTASMRTFCGVIATTPVKVNLQSSSSKGASVDEDQRDMKKNVMLSEQLLNKLLSALMKSKQYFELNKSGDKSNVDSLFSEESMLALFESEFLRQYRDAQYFVMKGINKIAMDLRASMDGDMKRSKGKDADESEEDSDFHDKGMGIVAENMCRVLIMMDYVARTASDLNQDAKYLFDPPQLMDDDTEDEGDDHERDEDDDSEEDDTESDSDSDESVEESRGAGRSKRAATSKGRSSNKRSRKTKVVTWQQSYKHRFALQQAWLSTLRIPDIPTRTQKHVLQHLSNYVLGICPSPLRFAEYFTRSFQAGTSKATGTNGSSSSSSSSLTSILALDGLFILMLDHQLEYPEFYSSLYQLLHPRILYTKQRTRFLQLLSKSLMGNTMLPAYVVASFCKKLCRLALSGPPSGGLFALALVSNLLRKHGECACLIHREGKREDVGLIEDVFVEEVGDLTQTRALESSLWELTALEKHYHHAISTVAKAVGTEDDKTTPMYDMDDFMAHTYKSLFEQEKKRLNGEAGDAKGSKKKARVSLTFVEPDALFTKDDVFGDFFKCN